ncbi:MAG: Protein of unknown function (DUF1553)/Protein of unknown function (DUF1549)/Planctomycete [Planctomycetaceae bacterium]|nr:Protein of unknown function (DUF1553)/Protein of unknown function (DUF1549)/Planctomycete [Planctomycetaceae bacterium]
MDRKCLTFAWFLLLGYCLHGCPASAVETPAPTPAEIEYFEKEVRPLLATHCYQCHSVGKKQKGGLLLDSREGLLTGGDTGPALVPGKSAESRLVEAIRYDNVDLKMPPKGKLKDDEIAVLTKWIDTGAKWPVSPVPGTKGAAKGEFNLAERAKHWSFQPLADVKPPAVKQADWPTADSDRFILAALEAKGLHPAPQTDKRTWLRRVSFDLIGLPPSAAEIDAFLTDESPQAYEKVVDRLLDSPHYGERWGRHWLDLVRFAETYGHEFDFEIANAWRYRDYVIRAFNSDLPYNKFVIEQIAGDLLPNPRRHPTEKFNESVIGTGFYWLGEQKHSPVDIRAEEAARVDNQIDVLCKTFMGMTVSCARCHDHKFDPIPTKDYYALFGFLQSSRMQQAFIEDPEPWARRLEELRAQETQVSQLTRQAVHAVRAEQIEQVWPKLTAAKEINAGNEVAVKAAAEQLGVERDILSRYLAEKKTAAENADHPLHAWATLSTVPAEQFATAQADLSQRLVEQAAKSKQAQADDYDLTDFNRPDYGDWFVSGFAFGDRPVVTADVLRMQALQRTLPPGVQAGVAHSGILSPRLRGVLRSPTFTLDRDRIWIRAAGKDVSIRLIMDEFHLVKSPIYGGLAINLPSPDKFGWIEINVKMWPGHRVYLEFLDEGDGVIAIDRIVMANGGPPPAAPSATALDLAQDSGIKSPADLQTRLQELLKQAVKFGERDQDVTNLSVAELATWLYRDGIFGSIPTAISRQPAAAQAEFTKQSAALAKFETEIPVPARAIGMTDGTPENERVFIRGSHKTQGEEVPRRLLEVLGANQPAITNGSGRLQLAERIVDPKNPLTVRVIVNRIWQHHFGEGLVRSPDDFGHMGQLPSHPELLDFLAKEFIQDGWSMKRMHRRLLLSSTYRMASQGDPAADAADPQNRLWHKMPVMRLEAEIIRDSILAVSGRLSKNQFGPGVLPYLTAYMNGRGRPGTGPLDGDGRRSIYINVRRNFLTPMLQAFDYPIPFTTIGRRTVSNVPAQALCLMNNQFVTQQAETWAKHLDSQAQQEPSARIQAMYVAAFSRPPSEQELLEGLDFVAAQGKLYPPDQQFRAWADYAHILFNVKEFIFLK